MYSHLERFFAEDIALTRVSDHASLAALLERIDIGERYGEKSYKAEYLCSDRVQLPPRGEACVVPVEKVLFSQESWRERR